MDEDTMKRVEELMAEGEDLAKRTKTLLQEAVDTGDDHWLVKMVADTSVSSALSHFGTEQPSHLGTIASLIIDQKVLSLIMAISVVKYNEIRARELVNGALD